jgi:hypothetical protein
MATYVLAFRSAPNRTPRAGEEAAWGSWFQSLGGAIADYGHRVGRVNVLGNGGAADGGNATVLGGYIVISADSLDAATTLAEGCPGLSNGGVVEVAEAVAS